MRKQKGPGRILMCMAMLLAGLPAMGHDPLREEHDFPHSDHYSDYYGSSRLGVDLLSVRALVIAFRETGDDRHLDEARELLEPALKSASPDPATLIAASFVAQSRHEFEYAVNLITKALAINDNNDEGRLLLASIQLVLGDVESASAACRQLRSVPPLVFLTCKARVALPSGNHQIALERLSNILNIVDPQRIAPDVLAWSFSVAGDLSVASDEADRAEMLYRRSLSLAERTQVRAALVDVLLIQADYDSAGQVLDEGSLALPLVVRRLIVAKELGHLLELQAMLSRVEQEFQVWIANEDWLHAREMARFYIDVLDQPVLARRLALINISLQREPEDQRLERRTRPITQTSTTSAPKQV